MSVIFTLLLICLFASDLYAETDYWSENFDKGWLFTYLDKINYKQYVNTEAKI